MIDLTSVRRRVVAECNWPEVTAKAVEDLYVAFLRSDVVVEPSPLIEVFWHAHVLDTRKYAEDCMLLCGRFIHHVPAEGGKGRCRKALAG